MSSQYDALSPASPLDVLDHPEHNFSDRQQLAGDVVPLPIGRPTDRSQADMVARNASAQKDRNAITTKDSDKVISYPSFLAKKFPLK